MKMEKAKITTYLMQVDAGLHRNKGPLVQVIKLRDYDELQAYVERLEIELDRLREIERKYHAGFR